ncbi:TetR family transcriptional regulator [Mycolicibacterium litorale]|nr:TetR family transcriptional regulator [Mycolicibacterium litorale]
MATPPHRRRAARHHHPLPTDAVPSRRGSSTARQAPITVEAIVDSALGIVEREGYEALTMRRVAGALETGPASLYAHIVNKEDLDDLLIGRLCSQIQLPDPDSQTWRDQIIDVCTQLRDQYLRYPGISRAALATAPTNLDTLRVSEGMLGIALAGGIDPQSAAWAVDALILYVNAFCLETALRNRVSDHSGWGVSREQLLNRFAALPDAFPATKRHAAELTSGTAHDRFDFTLTLIVDGLCGRK